MPAGARTTPSWCSHFIYCDAQINPFRRPRLPRCSRLSRSSFPFPGTQLGTAAAPGPFVRWKRDWDSYRRREQQRHPTPSDAYAHTERPSPVPLLSAFAARLRGALRGRCSAPAGGHGTVPPPPLPLLPRHSHACRAARDRGGEPRFSLAGKLDGSPRRTHFKTTSLYPAFRRQFVFCLTSL